VELRSFDDLRRDLIELQRGIMTRDYFGERFVSHNLSDEGLNSM